LAGAITQNPVDGRLQHAFSFSRRRLGWQTESSAHSRPVRLAGVGILSPREDTGPTPDGDLRCRPR